MSMENPQHVYAILEPENFGWWKVQVQALIQGIDEDAWTMVEEGWSKPIVMNDAGVIVVKPKRDWTIDEKSKSKYNSKALSLIWKSLSKAQFEQVQSCVTAKEAWDKLVTQYEGTDSVWRNWVDMLASKFGTMTMEEHESVEAFSGRLNAIANEASVLGKKYKDKKLVKKFLRSLPDKFQSHKSAIDVSMNSDDMTFPQVIGMMQAFELEYNTKVHIKAKDVAFKSNAEKRKSDEHENQIELIVKNHFKRLDQDQHKGVVSQQRSGSSHTIIDADKSLKQVAEHLVKIQNENKKLISENTQLNERIKLQCAEYEKFGKEARSDDLQGVVDRLNLLLKERFGECQKLRVKDMIMQNEIDHLKELLNGQKAESESLRGRLNEQLRNIKMLSKGTKDLDKLLSVGQPGKVHWGLGYQGGLSINKHVFMKASQPKMVMLKQQPQDGLVRRQLDVNHQKPQGVLIKKQPKMV
ncbi:hypothetical protein AALP_AA8G244600 [Arabis alpina]|uniref:DUF4219 domain-containing protein n=1 Tax=Arabis alpina TaxID=50452 RepID=A0A087G955_ARAAL|nr:hypothetical protein AALP_AA8G244600 [Arabis alpina]